MSTKTLPDLEILRQLFIYDAETGELIWRERPLEFFKSERERNSWNVRFASKKAGSKRKIRNNYYIIVKIFKSKFFAHRIIWKMHYGVEPPAIVDRININGIDNKISNLREAYNHQNAVNSRKRKDNTSGYRGVDFHTRDEKWVARISCKDKRIFLGYFDTAEEAHAAYQKAAVEHHGEFRPKS